MKYNYKIEYNHTIEEYMNKIDPLFDTHIKISLAEAQAFDKKFNAFSIDEKTKKPIYQYRILNKRNWWFINNTFYEVPSKYMSNK